MERYQRKSKLFNALIMKLLAVLCNNNGAHRLLGMRNALLLLVFLFWQQAFSQTKVGTWRSHLPMSSFSIIDHLDSKIYGVNRYGVVIYDQEDESVEALSKINHLSQTGISVFRCSEENSLCIVGYEDGNIDIIDNSNNVTNQPAIANSSIVGDKVINDVIFEDRTALVLTGLGAVRMELSSLNVLEYSLTNIDGENTGMTNGVLYNEGLYFTNELGVFSTPRDELFLSPQLTQIDFDRNMDNVSQFFELDNSLYLLYANPIDNNDTLFRLVNDQFIAQASLANTEMRHIDVSPEYVLITRRDRYSLLDHDWTQLDEIDQYFSNSGVDARMAQFFSGSDSVLMADFSYGGIISSFDNKDEALIFSINSPSRGNISELKDQDNTIYGLTGGNSSTFNTPFLFQYSNNEWGSNLLLYPEKNDATNAVDIALVDDKKYIGFDNSGLMILNQDNQLLESFSAETNEIGDDNIGYYGVRGVERDEDGGIWMLNSENVSTLSYLDPDGAWYGISLPDFLKPIAFDLLRLSNGYLVFSLKESGIVIYDPADTPSDVSDDRYEVITSNPEEGSLPNNAVNCMAEDRDGELWIGTDEGIGIIYNPSSVFEGGFEGVQRVIVNQGGFNGYLFETDAVMSIAVDGANRKWVAPRGAGLFLISDDGTEELLSFTEENSPLLSDNIADIEVLPNSGELFIATENGLLSYQPDASEPQESLSEIKVVPNPVKPGYSGLITFTNLTADAPVRVTDAAGNLIYETTSQGGTAVWDGRNRNGEKVSSGIYLVFAASRDGIGGAIAKIMFLN